MRPPLAQSAWSTPSPLPPNDHADCATLGRRRRTRRPELKEPECTCDDGDIPSSCHSERAKRVEESPEGRHRVAVLTVVPCFGGPFDSLGCTHSLRVTAVGATLGLPTGQKSGSNGRTPVRCREKSNTFVHPAGETPALQQVAPHPIKPQSTPPPSEALACDGLWGRASRLPFRYLPVEKMPTRSQISFNPLSIAMAFRVVAMVRWICVHLRFPRAMAAMHPCVPRASASLTCGEP